MLISSPIVYISKNNSTIHLTFNASR